MVRSILFFIFLIVSLPSFSMNLKCDLYELYGLEEFDTPIGTFNLKNNFLEINLISNGIITASVIKTQTIVNHAEEIRDHDGVQIGKKITTLFSNNNYQLFPIITFSIIELFDSNDNLVNKAIFLGANMFDCR